MTRADMIALIAHRTGASKALAKDALDGLFREIALEIAAGGEVPLPGIGNLRRVAYEARSGRNPRTGEALQTPPGWRAKFTQAKGMKDRLAALPKPFKAAAE